MKDKYNKKSNEIFEALEKEAKSSWSGEIGIGRAKELTSFIDKLLETYSKDLKLDKNIILKALEKQRDYSAINYYQPINFGFLESNKGLSKKIKELNVKIWNTKKEHKAKIIELQKEITKLRTLDVEKIEVEGSVYCNYGINVNCPFCESYEEVEEIDDWYPGEEFEGNQECGSCGKTFSVKSDGTI